MYQRERKYLRCTRNYSIAPMNICSECSAAWSRESEQYFFFVAGERGKRERNKTPAVLRKIYFDLRRQSGWERWRLFAAAPRNSLVNWSSLKRRQKKNCLNNLKLKAGEKFRKLRSRPSCKKKSLKVRKINPKLIQQVLMKEINLHEDQIKIFNCRKNRPKPCDECLEQFS